MRHILSPFLFIAPFVLSAQTPLWIWPDRAEKNETVYFRKVVELPAGKIKSAKLQATCDNGFSLFVNGKPALAGDNWNNNYGADIAKLFTAGPNVIAVEGRNQGGIAGFVAFRKAYEAEAGRAIDLRAVMYWQVIAEIRWAIISRQQEQRALSSGETSLELALSGYLTAEMERNMLDLITAIEAGATEGPL